MYSNVEGVDDLTFETCDPDFFGSGRFYAIGYAVDDAGEILVDDQGQIVGAFTMDLPPDDWEATDRDQPGFEINHGDLSIDIASPDQAGGGTMSWTIDGARAAGTATFVDFESTYTVEFDVVCEGEPTVDAGDLPADDGGGSNGMPIAGGHDNFLFRAARAQGNTNENLGTFIMLALSAVALGASPAWANGLAWVFVAARLGHMLTYYMDLRPARSACFGVGLLALIGLAVIATSAWL